MWCDILATIRWATLTRIITLFCDFWTIKAFWALWTAFQGVYPVWMAPSLFPYSKARQKSNNSMEVGCRDGSGSRVWTWRHMTVYVKFRFRKWHVHHDYTSYTSTDKHWCIPTHIHSFLPNQKPAGLASQLGTVGPCLASGVCRGGANPAAVAGF